MRIRYISEDFDADRSHWGIPHGGREAKSHPQSRCGIWQCIAGVRDDGAFGQRLLLQAEDRLERRPDETPICGI